MTQRRDRRAGQCIKPTLHSPKAVELARITAGMNQKQLAEKAGISPGFLSEVEGGTRGLAPENLLRIAQACGRDVATLINPDYLERAKAA